MGGGSTVVSIRACELRIPGSSPDIDFSCFGITAKWPKITQIVAILSSDETYNVVYM